MAYTELLSQEIGIPAAGIFPQSASGATLYTSWVDTAAYPQVEFRLDVGAMTTLASLAFQLMGSNTTTGNGTAIAGTSVTNLVNVSPTNNSNNSATILITAEKLNALGLGYRYVKAQVVASGAASLVAVSVREKDHRFGPSGPASGSPAPAVANDASVVQQINLFR
jgi:hypothetical protein